MLTPKQKQSIDFVCEVFDRIADHGKLNHYCVHESEKLQIAAKLTQVYFDNHYPDGTPCDSEEVSE